MKNAMPSIANGRPITWPQCDISPDHSTPISIDRIVPDTAPTANSRPMRLGPAPGQQPEDRVAGADPAPLGEQHEAGQPDPEAGKDDVPGEGEAHLRTCCDGVSRREVKHHADSPGDRRQRPTAGY